MEEDFDNYHFLNLIKRSKRGKFKLYIGMIAGVGKTYRMLQDAHQLLENGVDVMIGYVEPHDRAETINLVDGIPIIPRKHIFYKGKEIEEMDVDAIIRQHPDIVIVDELAHSNVEGSKNKKRWQDVMDILDTGINVISAVNIQHIESLNQDVEAITNVEVSERIPDSVLSAADEVVNIDLTSQDLIERLQNGKIYAPEKVENAMLHFFKPENILQLRELALKEVALRVEKKVEKEVSSPSQKTAGVLVACISTNYKSGRKIIRKAARLATYLNSRFIILYVRTPNESIDRIDLADQRHLINNFKLATELGAEVIQQEAPNLAEGIISVCSTHTVSAVCVGKPCMKIFRLLGSFMQTKKLLNIFEASSIDLIVLSK